MFDFCGVPSCKLINGVMSVQIYIQVSITDVDKVLRASGLDSMFVRPFFEIEEETPKFKIMPFTEETDLAGAVRQAGRMPCHYGVVKTRKGFGVRVLAEQYEEAVHIVRPSDSASFLGTRYEMSGLPLSCGRDAIVELLGSWTGAVPISTFRNSRSRTWVVSAPSPPLHDKVQHADGLAYIHVASQKGPPKKAQTIRFVPSERPREEPSWLRSWAGKARKQQGEPGATDAEPRQPMDVISQSPPTVSPSPPSVSSPDLASMIRDAVASAVASAVSPLSTAVAALDNKLAGVAADVELQKESNRRDTSSHLTAGVRADTRASSRSRGRVPIGRRL